ncbi:MAG: pilus assembly protein PilP [Desulfobacterales bacterium]|jgi:type IV pilus assembly protein PilP
MKKILIIICNLACLIGFLTVLLGCDPPANESVKPLIVTKKIKPIKNNTGLPPRKPARASQPASKPEPPAPGKQAPERTVLAKNAGPPAAKSAEAKKPKPSLAPKSDISDIKTTSPGQPEAPATGQTTVARTSPGARPIYDPKEKINPFEPLFREKPTVAGTKVKRKKRIPRTPLEKIDLSQLRLVGIITAASGNKALVEESNGKGYVIKKGTYIGTNAGKVVQIQSNKVIVAEEYEDYSGNVTVKNKEIQLPKPPGDF